MTCPTCPPPLRQQADFVMKEKKDFRIRMNINPETALELERLRKLKGYRSWEELFQEIILQSFVPDKQLPPIGKIVVSISEQIAQLQLEVKSLKEWVEKVAIEANEISSEVQATRSEIATIKDLITIDIKPVEENQTQPLTALQKYLRDQGL